MTEEEYFRKNYPDSCYGDKPLSPHWDFFQDGVEFGERQSEKRIKEIENYFVESAGYGRDKVRNFMDIVNKALEQKGERIEELEQKLEQTEKDLADYQFNYPTIKELQKELDYQKQARSIAENAVVDLTKENTDLKCECRRCIYTDCPCILSDFGKDRNGICDHFKDVFDENIELKKENTALKQDWEIMKNTIADYDDFCDKYMQLEKENAELKVDNAFYEKACEGATMMYEHLTKAKELLKHWVNSYGGVDITLCEESQKLISEWEIKEND